MRARLIGVLADVVLLGAASALAAVFGAVVVEGGSMEPALLRGDLVLYRRGPGGAASAGQLAVLGSPGRLYVHRVVRVLPSGRIVTRGDANPIDDREPTSTAAVRGRVVAVVPVGALLRRLVSPDGRVRLWSQSHSSGYDGDGVREGVASLREGLSTERARPAARTVHSNSCDLNASTVRQ